MFSDFFKTLHGLICDYIYEETVKKMFALSLFNTGKSVDRWTVCHVAGTAVHWVLLEMLYFKFVFVVVTDIGKYGSSCWFVGSVEKELVLPLQTYVCLNLGPLAEILRDLPLILVFVFLKLILVTTENLRTYDSQDIDHILETFFKEEGGTHIFDPCTFRLCFESRRTLRSAERLHYFLRIALFYLCIRRSVKSWR